MDEEIVFSLFGGSLFEEYNINPPWEKIHSAISKLYPLFFVIIGVHWAIVPPNCLPKDPEYAKELTDPEAKFVSDLCANKHAIEDSDVIMLTLIAGLFFLNVITHLFLEITGMRNHFSIFAWAEKKLEPLGKIEKTGSGLFRRLLDDPFASELRNVVDSISTLEHECVFFCLLLRDIVIFGALFFIAIHLWIWKAPYKHTPTYSCHVYDNEYNFSWSPNKTDFTCERCSANDCLRIEIFFTIALGIDFFARGMSLVHLILFLIRSKPNTNIRSARSALLVNYFLKNSRVEYERIFSEFVRLTFSMDNVGEIQKHLASIREGNDQLMEKFAPFNPMPNPSNRGEREPLLPLKERWKWIMFLANEDSAVVDDPDIFSQSDPDETGNSLSFYVIQMARMRKIRGETAVKILKHNTHFRDNGVKVETTRYLEHGFGSDEAYQEQLKDDIAEAIRGHKGR